MNTQKAALIALCALVVLFIFGIAGGLRGQASPQPINLSDLSGSSLNSLVSAPLDLNDLTRTGGPAQCLQKNNRQFAVPANTTCAFVIAQSAMPTRRLTLHLLTPSVAVDVVFLQNRKQAFDVRQSLPADDPLKLSIFNADDAAKPATLALTCRGMTMCRVAIQ